MTESDLESPAFVEVVPGGPVTGEIRPPGSKSLTNRALLCAAMATGTSFLSGTLRSEDTGVMIDALEMLGVEVEVNCEGRNLRVVTSQRTIGWPSDPPTSMFVANSGTTIRFLTAALSAHGGSFLLHGVDRMHERPIGDLVQAIDEVIDGSIQTLSPGGCPPVQIRCTGWKGRQVKVAGNVSSQFLSGLMMAAPIASAAGQGEPIEIEVVGQLVSRPYVDMTADVMRDFDADVDIQCDADRFCVVVGPKPYRAADYQVEPDASAASYFWAAAAITGGEVKVHGLSADAMQGDVGFVDVLEMMGCQVDRRSGSIKVIGGKLRGIDVDMNVISDTVQTLAVVALFADGPTRVRGVAHNRFKETDRIGDLACELRKLGARVDEHDDGMTIHPPERIHRAELETYHDHRMAMSLSLAGLRVEGVRILNPSCTSKTYPEFFHDLETLIGRPHRWA